MKKANKALLLVLCAILLVAGSVMGTLAYLTSQASVQNTFTVGHVVITLDETDTDDSTAGAERDTANKYHLIPGITIPKDPIVHVQANSENSWIFVKVENGLAGYEVDAKDGDTIHEQIIANGWDWLQEGVYYKSYTQSENNVDLPVFANVTIANTNVKGAAWTAIKDAKIIVTAYAIQKANGASEFSAADAWAKVGS